MYFKYNHVANGRTLTAMGGTDVIGQLGPSSASAYSFAEGYTNVGYDQWLTVQNPTATSESITVSLVNAMGNVYTVDIVAAVLQHLYQRGSNLLLAAQQRFARDGDHCKPRDWFPPFWNGLSSGPYYYPIFYDIIPFST